MSGLTEVLNCLHQYSGKFVLVTINCCVFTLFRYTSIALTDAFGGRGEGIYRENDCEPNCAEGTISSRPATVLLSDLTFDGTRYFFNTAKVRFKDVDYVRDEYEFIWDIASFYREVPEMRSKNIYEY